MRCLQGIQAPINSSVGPTLDQRQDRGDRDAADFLSLENERGRSLTRLAAENGCKVTWKVHRDFPFEVKLP